MLGGCWLYDSLQGEFRIELVCVAGRRCYGAFWEAELLGCFGTPAAAAASLARGDVCKPSCGLDVCRLGLPPALVDWIFVPPCSASSTAEAARTGAEQYVAH